MIDIHLPKFLGSGGVGKNKICPPWIMYLNQNCADHPHPKLIIYYTPS